MLNSWWDDFLLLSVTHVASNSEAFSDTLTLSDELATGQIYAASLSSSFALSDKFQLASRRTERSLVLGTWNSPTRLAETLWTINTSCGCPCDIEHVGPQGCPGEVFVPAGGTFTNALPDGMSIDDNLTSVYIPGTLTTFEAGSSLEGFEAPETYYNGGSTALYAGGTASYSKSTTVRANTGTYSLKTICNTSSSGGLTFDRKGFDISGTEKWTYQRAYFYIESFTNTNGSERGKHLFGWFDSNFRSECVLIFPAAGGNLKIRVSHEGIPGFSGKQTSSSTLATGTWYRAELVTEELVSGMTSTLFLYAGDSSTVIEKLQCHDGGVALGGFPYIAHAAPTNSGNAITFLVDDWRVQSSKDVTPPTVAAEGPLKGPGGVFMMYPTGADTSEWTPLSSTNYSNVDEFPVGTFDDDTTYVSSTGSGQKTDLYTVGFLPNTIPATGVISAVEVRARTRTVPAAGNIALVSVYAGYNGVVHTGTQVTDDTSANYLNFPGDSADHRPHVFLEFPSGGGIPESLKSFQKIGIRRNNVGGTGGERVTAVWGAVDVQTP